jgi:ribonuclease-3
MEKNLTEFETSIGVSFSNTDLLREALTHRSYLNENPEWGVNHNERLEYLGDAVLELIVTEELFASFTGREEGELTAIRAALVNSQMIGKVARQMKLDEWLFLSKGEARDAGKARDVILANAYEAVLGALYLDKGYDAAKEFVSRTLFPWIQPVVERKLYIDPKSMLQEVVQEKMKLTPSYKVLEEKGPDHQKRFFVGVFFGETLAAQGDGLSKQEAEVNAARTALDIFQNQP